MGRTPATQYVRSGTANIAYQVIGEGPDLLFISGWASNLEIAWENSLFTAFLNRLAANFRLIRFDKRGTGLSDRVAVERLPTLEERAEDLRAVLDAAGSTRAALLGYSEGGSLAAYCAAAHPERVTHLVLYASFARIDPPHSVIFGVKVEPSEFRNLIIERWADGFPGLEFWAPTIAGSEAARAGWARAMRLSATPAAAAALFAMVMDTDVRPILPSVHVPTLVIHRSGDRIVGVSLGREMADLIPGARWLEIPGDDHLIYVGDEDAILAPVEEFLGTRRPAAPTERVLATLLFTDLVGSTERSAAVGDLAWTRLMQRHDRITREELRKFEGREIDTAGDGFLAVFDGPARAIRCADAIRDSLSAANLRIRCGVHTGECVMVEGKVRGVAVNTAARIAALAGAGEIFVSRTVKELVAGSGLLFNEAGIHVLKGLSGEWPLYRVAGLRSV